MTSGAIGVLNGGRQRQRLSWVAAAVALCAPVAGLTPAQAQPMPHPMPHSMAHPMSSEVQSAWAAKTLHLRAGPAREYPVVAIVPSGTMLEVFGCLRGYTWCDVAHGPQRGWVYAANLRMQWQGQERPAPDIGAQLGVGIIGFILGEYWADHYREHHFYRDRDRWHSPPPRMSPMPGFPFPMPSPPPQRQPQPPKQEPPRPKLPPGHGSPPGHGASGPHP